MLFKLPSILLLLCLTTTLYAQTDSTKSYLFRHYPYDSLTKGQIAKLEEIKSTNKDMLLNQSFVKLKEYLLQTGAFYANFSQDSVVFVTGRFESFGDWNYYFWSGRVNIPDSVGIMSMTFQTHGWDFDLSYLWRFFTPDSHYYRYYTLRFLGDSMYFLGEYHHKVPTDPSGSFACESPTTTLPVALRLAESLKDGIEGVEPWKKLGQDVSFCHSDSIYVYYTITDMSGRSITLIDKLFTGIQTTFRLPNPRLAKGMYVFWLIGRGKSNYENYTYSAKMVKVE